MIRISRTNLLKPLVSLLIFWGYAQAQDLNSEVFRDCSSCPEMAVIPSGPYGFGSPPNEFGGPYNEGYILDIYFEQPFAIARHEVTFTQWELCVKDNVCRPIDDEGYGRGERPVNNVSWEDTQVFVGWLSNKTGKAYRLPSEAEWEYAAQSGTKRKRFFGINPEDTCIFGNVYDEDAEREYAYGWHTLPCRDGFTGPSPVGLFEPNVFGTYDMLGNVWEWVEDCLNPNWRHSRAPLNGSAYTDGDCDQRAYRGGSWLTNQPYYLRTAERYKFIRVNQIDLGFRVARDLN